MYLHLMSAAQQPATQQSFRGLGRRLERFAWCFRSYFIPSHLRTYRELVQNHALQTGDAERTLVCFDFTQVDIDASTGRYLFALVTDFEALGHLTCYMANFRFLATMRHKRHKRLLLQRPFRVCKSLHEIRLDRLALLITDRETIPPGFSGRAVRVCYDPRWPKQINEVAMTFGIHPELYDVFEQAPPPNLTEHRPWRVFFAGTTVGARYGHDLLRSRFGKMSRVEILHTLVAKLPATRIRRILSEADLASDNPTPPSFVWAGTGEYRIPWNQWHSTLDKSAFFLACPGVEMPLCHNLVEALARGSVPILEHPEFLEPAMTHDVNCLEFKGQDELIATFERIFQMPEPEIQRLRAGAMAYYREHLAAGRFASKLLNHPHTQVDLFLNAYRVPKA